MRAGSMLIRSGVVISALGHVVVLGVGFIFAGANPFDDVPVEAIAVDIVSPDEIDGTSAAAPTTPVTPDDGFSADSGSAPASSGQAAHPPNAQSSAAAAPSSTASSSAAQSPNGQPSNAEPTRPSVPAALRSPQPRVAQLNAAASSKGSAPQGNGRQTAVTAPAPSPMVAPPQFPTFPAPFRTAPAPVASDASPENTNFAQLFALPLTLPGGQLGGEFDAPAIDSAEIGVDATAAFRDRLKTCASLPGTISSADRIRIVLRVSLAPNGTLAGDPVLIEASASAKGPALMQSAVRALRACAPYTMLPPDKYKEWKTLDLSFTPQDMAGG
jgi:hypothetical protein